MHNTTNNETRWDLVFNCLNVQKAILDKSFSNLILKAELWCNEFMFKSVIRIDRLCYLDKTKVIIQGLYTIFVTPKGKLKGWN